jgi:hypothetical protein
MIKLGGRDRDGGKDRRLFINGSCRFAPVVTGTGLMRVKSG